MATLKSKHDKGCEYSPIHHSKSIKQLINNTFFLDFIQQTKESLTHSDKIGFDSMLYSLVDELTNSLKDAKHSVTFYCH